ncbi:hypothetical protein AN958_12296 [Leucoagaricus sp. SymC.cos]|nr:hypothetical protein AN958_12296 [Leucoagaricus sp. SymC.cos]
MTLKEGTYRIRYVPVGLQPPFVGGLYAKSTEFGEPLLAEPETPGNPPQIWEVHRNENGKYIITQPGFKTKFAGIGPVLFGWSLSNPSEKFPGGNILFKVNYAEFEIEQVGSGDHLMYSIKVPNPEGPHSPTLNSEFFVAERDHLLVSQAYWSSLRVSRPHPHWQFIPA